MALPSEYGFTQFDAAFAREHGPVILATRVSSPKQEWAGNLEDQEAWLSNHMARNRVRIACGVSEQVTGQGTAFARMVVQKARQCGVKVVVAESLDRLMRPTGWTVREQERWYDGEDLKDLQQTMKGLTVMTVTNPDAKLAEVRAAHTKRGNEMKSATQTKKYRKPLRDALKPKIMRMRRNGRTIREIASSIGVPYQTVHHWISTYAFCQSSRQ